MAQEAQPDLSAFAVESPDKLDLSAFAEKQPDGPDLAAFGESQSQAPDLSSFVQEPKEPQEPQEPEEDVGLLDMAKGLVAEIIIGEGLPIVGAAATGLLTKNPQAAGAAYLAIRGGSGAIGSVAAQKVEGREDISEGRVVADSLINMIPGAKAAEGVSVARRIASATMRQSAVGAAISPAALAIEAGVEGDDISSEDLVRASIWGAALGGGLGIAGEGVGSLARKFGGNEGKVYDAVRRGDIEAVELLNRANDLIDQKDLPPKGIFRRVLEYGAPSLKTPSEIRTILRNAEEEMQGIRELASSNSRIDKLLKRLSPEERKIAESEMMDTFLTGKPMSVAPEIEGIVKQQYNEVMDFKRQMVENHYRGVKPLPDNLVKHLNYELERGIGHITREYQMFTNPKWKDDPAKFKSAVDALLNIREYKVDKRSGKIIEKRPYKTRKDAENYLSELKGNASRERQLYSGLGSGNARVNILKKRVDLPEEVRDWMGEIKQPSERIRGTVEAMGLRAIGDKADLEVREVLKKMGLADVDASKLGDAVPLRLRRGRAVEGFDASVEAKQLETALDDVKARIKDAKEVLANPMTTQTIRKQMKEHLSELQEHRRSIQALMADAKEPLFVQREVMDGLAAMQSSKELNRHIDFFLSAIQNATALSKGTKVLMNPPSYLIQAYGQIAMVAAAGQNPVRGLKTGFKSTVANNGWVKGGKTTPAFEKAFARAKKLGLIQGGVVVSDIRAGLENGLMGKGLDVMFKPLGKVYSIPDNTFRLVSWQNNIDMLNKMMPELASPGKKVFEGIKRTHQEIAEILAARITHDTYTNYDRVLPLLKKLSQYGIANQFATFTFDLYRVIANQAVLAVKMMNGSFTKKLEQELGMKVNDKVVRRNGLLRMGSLIAVSGSGLAAGAYINRKVFGTDEETEMAYRESVGYEWDKDREILLKRDGQNFGSASLSYLIPHVQAAGIITNALRGDDPVDIVKKSMGAVFKDILGDGMFVNQNLQGAIMNYIPGTDKQVSTEPNDLENAVERASWYIGETFKPGIYREFERIFTGEKEQRQDAQTTMARLAGVRWNTVNLIEGAGFHVRDSRNTLNSLRSNYLGELYKSDREPVTSKQIYDKFNAEYKQNFQELLKHAQNYRTLRMSDSEILRLFNNNGISRRDAFYALRGIAPDMKVKEIYTADNVYDSLLGANDKERSEILSNPLITDKVRQEVIEKEKEVQEMRAKGISEIDLAIKSMSPEERARIIYDMARENGNVVDYYNEMERKGVLTKKTKEYLRLLERAD